MPKKFLYETLNVFFIFIFRSGLLNFCAVALALNELGYKAVGIRIDSGDLAYLSNKAREIFERIAEEYEFLFILIFIRPFIKFDFFI